MRTALRSTEQQLKEIDEQIHYTGQYLSNKEFFSQYLKSWNKKHIHQEYQAKIILYETAREFLKERSGPGKLPSMKSLKRKNCQS